VHRVHVGDHIRVGVLVFEEECAEVGLSALHHLFDGCDDGGVPYNDSFVEAREEWAAGDRESKHLWIEFGNRLLCY
jgi:hypothetical protein